MSDYIPRSQVYWLLGGVIAICVSVQMTLILAFRDHLDRRFDARTETLQQFETRFASDIDQHDKRIANNADNLRSLTIAVGLGDGEAQP